MPFTISDDLLASLFSPQSPLSNLFGNQAQPIPNANGTASPSNIPNASTTPPAPQQANSQAPRNPLTGQNTDDTSPFTWQPPAGTPKPQSGMDMLHNLVMDKNNQIPPTPGTQAPQPGTPPIDPTMAAAAAKNTTPPAPPPVAKLDTFGTEAAASKPQAPVSSTPTAPTSPSFGQPQSIQDLLLGNGTDTSTAPASNPNVTPKGAVDYGKSAKNIADASGQNAPIPARPIAPGDRDINPATGKPFTTQDWNNFKAGINPDTGAKFSSPEEQALYAKNNGIDQSSFANNHHTLQNVIGSALAIASQLPGRMAPHGGRLGPVPEYLQNQVEQGENFFNNIAQQKMAGQNYDVNKGSMQTQANINREVQTAAMQKTVAQTNQAQSIADQNSGKGGLTGEALDQAAERFAQTGVMPPMSRGAAGLAQSRAIMNRAAELHPGGSIATNSAEYAANKQSLGKLQTNFDQVTAFENTAGKNLDVFLATAQKVKDSGAPWINKPLREIDSKALGSADQAAFNAARTTAIAEISKVLSSANAGSGVVSDSARGEVEALIGPDATLSQIMSAASILKQDMANRHTSFQEQIDAVQTRLGGKSASSSTATPPAAASTPAGNSAPPAAAAQPQEKPVYVNNKLVGYTTDGKTFSRKVGS